MPQSITLAFVANSKDVIWATNYSQFHPQEKMKLFPTHIPALLYLLKLHPKSIHRIDTYVKRHHNLQSALSLPLTLAQQLVASNSHLRLLTEVFRAEFTKALSHYYILHQITRQTYCSKIIISPSSLSLQATRQFIQDFNLDYEVIPPPSTSILRQLQRKFSVYLEPLRWLLTHPQELFPFLGQFLPTRTPSKAAILIFSNGLNLASYHSVIKALTRYTSVKIITDQQGFKDKLYLSKYGIRGQQLRSNSTSLQGTVNKKINLATLKSTPWFISLNGLKQLTRTLASWVISRNGGKILAKYIQAQQLIVKFRPRLVITTHDPGPSGLSFVAAAQARKIKTLVLVHGAPSGIHYFYSDYQLIWGKLMRRLLIKTGLSKHRLKLGGHPIYADYKKYFMSHLSKSTSLTIGILTTGDGKYEWHQTLYFWDLFLALKPLKNHRLLVRTHGMQNLELLNQLAHHFGLKINLNPPLHLEEFVAQSDIIVTQNSTAALVPLIAHKPTILFDPWFPFLDEGLIKSSPALFKPSSIKQLSYLIHQITAGRLQRNLFKIQDHFIDQFCGPLDPQMGERIARQIRSL